MRELALTLNAGSSSIKFAVYEIGEAAPALLLSGSVEKIGGDARLAARAADGRDLADRPLAAERPSDHEHALGEILGLIGEAFPGAPLPVVGHRVVHGANAFDGPVVIDADVIETLERFTPFAPLHQPHNLHGIAAARAAFPDAMQVACFDTAFHRGHPFVNDVFALPREYYDRGVRRYGFHGLSYQAITGMLAASEPALHAGRLVVAHLGNGASMCAIAGGRSLGSTMGFSAIDGLPMGTRCGQLDPGVVLYLMEQEGMGVDEITDLLYRRSGLLGLSGLSNDMRTLEEAGTEAAEQAIAYFVFRVRRELGAMAAVLGGLDGVVFTGGIGAHSARVRGEVLADCGWLGIELDTAANAAGARRITTAESRVTALKMDTDEEGVIARAAADLFHKRTA